MKRIPPGSEDLRLDHSGSQLSSWQSSSDPSLMDSTKIYPGGIELASHGSRHDRGGADPIDWSSVSRYHVATGITASAGASGSPVTTKVLGTDTDYYNLLPLTIKLTPSGLGTSETLTIDIIAKDQSGNSYTLASKSGVSAAVTLTIADLDFTVLADGSRIVEIDVSVESSATSTSATVSVDIAALEF